MLVGLVKPVKVGVFGVIVAGIVEEVKVLRIVVAILTTK